MVKENMTIHKALCEIKLADKKINSLMLMNQIPFVEVNTNPGNDNYKVKGMDIKSYAVEATSNYQSITDLIKRIDAIKSAISKSNASTMVNIGGKEMTVAEAIYQMKYGIKTKKQLLNTLTRQLDFAKIRLEEATKETEKKLDKTVETLYGSKDKNVSAETVLNFRKNYLQDNQPVLIDPINIIKEINKLSIDIDNFELNVDSALQVSNATTIIEIEY